MRKLRIYLDTSVISDLIADDAPKMMEYSLRLWDEIKACLYDVYISDLVIAEIDACSEPKKSGLKKYLDEVIFAESSVNEEVVSLAKQYVDAGLIPVKYEDDAFHIAMATILDCSALVSWNFTHIVKLKTIIGVNSINIGHGYREIEIVSPMSIVAEEEE